MSPAETSESRRSYHRHDRACGCAQAGQGGSFPPQVMGMGRITQETFSTAKVSILWVKEVLRSGGTTDRWTCQSLAVAPGEVHTLGTCLSSVAAVIAMDLGWGTEAKGLLLAIPSTHPPFFHTIMLSRGY